MAVVSGNVWGLEELDHRSFAERKRERERERRGHVGEGSHHRKQRCKGDQGGRHG